MFARKSHARHGAILAAALLTGVSGAAIADEAVFYRAGHRNWTHVKSMVIEEGHPL